ncbi:MAG: AAA family ATPase [Bacilli bacterium]
MIPIEQLNIDIKKDNIIEGIMKSNGLYCLVAEPKVGKSFLALQIANSLTNNKEFLGFKVNPTPVLYISTELSSLQLKERLNITSYEFSPNSFFFLEKDSEHKLCLTDDLQLELKEFSETYNGKFVIVDIMCGIDYGYELDINNYSDVMKKMFDKYRELSKKYNLTFLLVHHLNKEGKTLGSTGIDGNMNGILTLINNKDNTYTLKIINRDFEEQNLNLIKNDKLIFEIMNEDNTELDFNLSCFMRYVIKKKEVIFTPAEIVAELNLLITPSRFGRLLNSNIKRLEQEGIYIELNRTATSRNYKAKFIEPLSIEE